MAGDYSIFPRIMSDKFSLFYEFAVKRGSSCKHRWVIFDGFAFVTTQKPWECPGATTVPNSLRHCNCPHYFVTCLPENVPLFIYRPPGLPKFQRQTRSYSPRPIFAIIYYPKQMEYRDTNNDLNCKCMIKTIWINQNDGDPFYIRK